MKWIDKLQERWELENSQQVWTVLLVFALTGTTIAVIKPYFLGLFGENVRESQIFSICYYVLILPVYNIVLLFYGFLFGHFSFFWKFEKRMWDRMAGKKKNDSNR